MMNYNAQIAPAADDWLAEPEALRLAAVEDYHLEIGSQAPSPRAHATIHVAVENQIAEGLDAARSAVERVMAEGLDRHDAIHAIGSVLTHHLYGVLKEQREFDAARYEADLEALTAEAWLASGDDVEPERPSRRSTSKRPKIIVRRGKRR